MLPFMIGTACLLGIGIAVYLHYQPNGAHSFDYANRSQRSSPPPSNQNRHYNIDICVICLERIESTVSTDLKCGHTYHTDCLANLIMNQHKRCPHCGSDIEIRSSGNN